MIPSYNQVHPDYFSFGVQIYFAVVVVVSVEDSNLNLSLEFFIVDEKRLSKASFSATLKWFFQSPISPVTVNNIFCKKKP